MRGIVLAGGTGSRLEPLTKTINKHLLPVWDRHMIMWPIQTLKDNGIDDITIVSSPSGIGQIAPALGGGYTYRVQDKPGGIAQAIMCASNRFDDRVAVILGDNIFLPSPIIFHTTIDLDTRLAICYLHKSVAHDLTQFGIPRMSAGQHEIEEVVEKPENPPSQFVVTGLYIFSHDVFSLIPSLKTSRRGETEVTDLLNLYAADRLLAYYTHRGFWMDAGTHESLLVCSGAASKWIVPSPETRT